MGCTEIPLALPQAPQARGAELVDPAWILAVRWRRTPSRG
jgi:aspartate racemase